MGLFRLAAKTTKPTDHFHLLRGLFRAISGGGRKSELSYKEVSGDAGILESPTPCIRWNGEGYDSGTVLLCITHLS